jgi:hypothetical protein
MPALINNFFGGGLEGLFGATPFEVLHQLLLGIFKYILESLYNHRTIPEELTCSFKERKSPYIPENIPDQKRITETTDIAFFDQEQPKKRAKTKKDTCTSYQKYLHWQKSRRNTCTSTRNVFSKLYFDMSIVIWKGKAIVIFQNCQTDLG